MAGPYLTHDELKQRVAGVLQKDVATLDPRWDGHVANGLDFGWQEIADRLSARGFTEGQIDSWDRRVEFNETLGIFRALTLGAMLTSFDDRYIKMFDRRGDLDKLQVIRIGGVATAPSPPTAGNLAYGVGTLAADKVEEINCLDWWD